MVFPRTFIIIWIYLSIIYLYDILFLIYLFLKALQLDHPKNLHSNLPWSRAPSMAKIIQSISLHLRGKL